MYVEMETVIDFHIRTKVLKYGHSICLILHFFPISLLITLQYLLICHINRNSPLK